MKRTIKILLVLLLGGWAGPLSAQDTTAYAILKTMEDRQESVQAEVSTLRMDIYDKRGRKRTRTMTVRTRTTGGRTASLLVFEAPADIRGTGLLTVETEAGEEQKLYLPALRRVQRIAGGKRGERFAGSDFSYEDLGTRNADAYTSTLLETRPDTWVVAAVPKDEAAPYSRIEFEIDRARYVVVKALYYDRKERPWKTYTAGNFEEIQSGVWRAGTMTMEDQQEARRTELTMLSREIPAGLPDALFTERELKRGVR